MLRGKQFSGMVISTVGSDLLVMEHTRYPREHVKWCITDEFGSEKGPHVPQCVTTCNAGIPDPSSCWIPCCFSYDSVSQCAGTVADGAEGGLGPCHPRRRPRWSSWFLGSAWLDPSCCKHLGGKVADETSLSLHLSLLSLFLNKLIYLFQLIRIVF